MSDLFLKALRCKNKKRPPVWLMRQAGRYLPEYRALRERYSLSELFHHPEFVVLISRLPVDLLGTDAAILFSDILMIAEAFGLTIQFPEKGGPFIEEVLQSPADLLSRPLLAIEEKLAYALKGIEILRKQLTVPLIGFCGGPFTVASYLIQKGRSAKEWLYSEPENFHLALQKLTLATITYLQLQIKAGVQVVQVFDSWANVLTYPQFLEFSAPYLKQIVEALKKTKVPVILFCRGSSGLAEELASLNPSAISFDWQKELSDLRKKVPPQIAVQGNLDPELLKAPIPTIRKTVSALLDKMKGEPGFVVNLGHGVLPDTPVDHVRCFIDTVKDS
jgi:uroporphyrinogen decarboxylase